MYGNVTQGWIQLKRLVKSGRQEAFYIIAILFIYVQCKKKKSYNEMDARPRNRYFSTSNTCLL